jgi:hypothetical protein
MSPLTAGVFARYRNVASPGPLGDNILMFAAVGPNGTGSPDVLKQLDSEATAREWLGDSQGAEAAAEYFANLPILKRTTSLWVFGLDDNTWTANTWSITCTGTTTQAGTRFLRIGPHDIAVALPNGADPTAQAAAIVAAVTAAIVPYTASNLAGVVTLTSKHLGLNARYTPITADLYTGENGVAGSTWDIVNNADATGEPAALNATQQTEIRKLEGAVYWVHHNRSTSWLDSLEAEAEYGWENRNNYALVAYAVSTENETTFTALAGVRNDRRHHYAAIGDAPEYELSASLKAIATIVEERRDTGLQNPGMVDVQFRRLRAGALMFDEKAIEAAGGSFVYGKGGNSFYRHVLTNRLENALGQPDISEWSVSGLLARREALERVGNDVLAPHKGDLIVQDGGPTGANFISASQLTDEAATLMVSLFREGILEVGSEDAARALIESVTRTTDTNIENGWLVEFSAPIVKVTRRLEAVAYTS